MQQSLFLLLMMSSFISYAGIIQDQKSLRSQLIGAWELVSYIEFPVDGSASTYPLGKKATGLIIYTPDGYMSAQLMGDTRLPFKSGDWFNGTPEEYIEEAKTYIAYSGRFFVEEDTQQLKHEMQVSLFPNWIGQKQLRVVSLEGNILKLGPATPIMSKGKRVMSQLIWKRAPSN
ncbi:MAG: lipocalin-like domain-containing protein [Acinetobacter sp.]